MPPSSVAGRSRSSTCKHPSSSSQEWLLNLQNARSPPSPSPLPLEVPAPSPSPLPLPLPLAAPPTASGAGWWRRYSATASAKSNRLSDGASRAWSTASGSGPGASTSAACAKPPARAVYLAPFTAATVAAGSAGMRPGGTTREPETSPKGAWACRNTRPRNTHADMGEPSMPPRSTAAVPHADNVPVVVVSKPPPRPSPASTTPKLTPAEASMSLLRRATTRSTTCAAGASPFIARATPRLLAAAACTSSRSTSAVSCLARRSGCGMPVSVDVSTSTPRHRAYADTASAARMSRKCTVPARQCTERSSLGAAASTSFTKLYASTMCPSRRLAMAASTRHATHAGSRSTDAVSACKPPAMSPCCAKQMPRRRCPGADRGCARATHRHWEAHLPHLRVASSSAPSVACDLTSSGSSPTAVDRWSTAASSVAASTPSTSRMRARDGGGMAWKTRHSAKPRCAEPTIGSLATSA